MKIGVTGSFASGKGTVCSFLKELGAEIIDTDEIAKTLTQKDHPVFHALVKHFGSKILYTDGSLNRREFATFVFSDKTKTSELNKIMHPEILKETLSKTSDSSKIYAINAPLLFESGFNEYMDLIITVTADIQHSIKRGKIRDNLPENEIILRINRQISLKEKAERSDYIIDNSGNLENTKRQVIEIWNKIFSKIQK